MRGRSAAANIELFSIDPNDNTKLELDLEVGANSGSPNYLVVFNNKVCFDGDDGTDDSIWCYDPDLGTASKIAGWNNRAYYLYVWNNKLYFVGDDGNNQSPYVYDGVNAPIEIVDHDLEDVGDDVN